MMTPAPTFRGRLWRFTKRLSLLATLIVLAAVPAAAFGVPALARSPWARARAEKALTRSLGTPVQVSEMNWSWKSGLTLHNVSGTAIQVGSLSVQPRYGKLLSGKLRARATLDSPEVTLIDTGSASPILQFPRLPRKGCRIDKLEIRNGTCIVKRGDTNIRLGGLEARADGRVENGTLRFELSSVSGTCDGLEFSGKGRIRVTQEGLEGELDLKEPAAKESASLQNALRALHLTIKKAPVLSEPF